MPFEGSPRIATPTGVGRIVGATTIGSPITRGWRETLNRPARSITSPRGGNGSDESGNVDLAEGYRRNERFDDDRFVDELRASSIVTSGRSEDTGLFARDYDDDRSLPFEGAGLADSRWELDLLADGGADLSVVADVALVIDYSAVDGGAARGGGRRAPIAEFVPTPR